MTPDFATLLESVPQRERRGRVFKLLDVDGTLLREGRWDAGKIVSAIGEKAGVVVDERMKGGEASYLAPLDTGFEMSGCNLR